MYNFEMIRNMDIDHLEEFLNMPACVHCRFYEGKSKGLCYGNGVSCDSVSSSNTKDWLMTEATETDLKRWKIKTDIMRDLSYYREENTSLRKSLGAYNRKKGNKNVCKR